jgi:hypothetical protein
MKKWWMVKIAKGVVIVGVMTLALGFVVMALWNALVPELFHGPVLTFWQSIGLLLLTHILLAARPLAQTTRREARFNVTGRARKVQGAQASSLWPLWTRRTGRRDREAVSMVCIS